MALSIRDYTIVTVVQATHRQDNVRCGAFRGIKYSCISLISVSRTFFKSPGLWDKFDLDYILGKGYQLIKLIGKSRHLGMEDLPQKFLIKKSSVIVEFLENKTREITDGVYLK